MVNIVDWLDYYSDFFPHQDVEVEFIESYLENQDNAKLLYVECGMAPLSKDFLSKYDVTFTDKFSEYTTLLNKRLIHKNNRVHIFNLDPIDIARYLAKDFFSTIFCLHNKMIFMQDDVLIKKFLFDSKMLLKENGKIILGLSNFSKYDLQKDIIEFPTVKSSRGSLKVHLSKDKELVSYRLSGEIIPSNGKTIQISQNEKVFQLGLETIKKIAEELKFSSVEFFGDYLKSPFNKNSSNLICVLTK
ncbi:MAG: hypothetical protein IJ293_01175 [Treponema sp.]|nr:hypothetical protein [Treponema sp.]